KRYSEQPEKVKEVLDFVRQSGGLEYAQKAMIRYRSDAFALLKGLPMTPARQSLEDLVVFVTEREK
ncbi:hypothetical protein RZS08_65755, partial [Arthrospira platensis SPKY1]|nr:hypothetical protein [Arthrospira platensis SPKY1]